MASLNVTDKKAGEWKDNLALEFWLVSLCLCQVNHIEWLAFIVFCFFPLFASPLPLWIWLFFCFFSSFCEPITFMDLRMTFDFLINRTRNFYFYFYPKKKNLTPNFAKIFPNCGSTIYNSKQMVTKIVMYLIILALFWFSIKITL